LVITKPFPDHRHIGRWQMPFRRTRRHVQSLKIEVLVAGAASHSRNTVPVETTAHIHRVPVAVVSLAGKVAAGMTIHTTGMMQDRNHGLKSLGGSSIVPLCCWTSRPHHRRSYHRRKYHAARHRDHHQGQRAFAVFHLPMHVFCSVPRQL
jgi:hypothetical protein